MNFNWASWSDNIHAVVKTVLKCNLLPLILSLTRRRSSFTWGLCTHSGKSSWFSRLSHPDYFEFHLTLRKLRSKRISDNKGNQSTMKKNVQLFFQCKGGESFISKQRYFSRYVLCVWRYFVNNQLERKQIYKIIKNWSSSNPSYLSLCSLSRFRRLLRQHIGVTVTHK